MTRSEGGAALTLRVLFFGVLREKTEREAITVFSNEPMTCKDLVDRLAEQYPSVKSYRAVIRIARNHSYEDEDVFLEDGDEVVLLTPYSGG